MKRLHLLLVIGLGALAFLMPILRLKPYVANSIQLLAYTLILTRKEENCGEDLSRKADLTLVEKMLDYPENLNLEDSVFKTLLNVDFKTDYRWLFEKAVRDNINGRPVEETFSSCSKALDRTGGFLIRLVSSLFAKDAVSAKKILRSYVFLLRENETLKSERRTLFSEARFRARIMLSVSASLMGFLSAAAPVLNTFSTFSLNPVLQQDLSQPFSLFLYVLSVSLLVHHSLACRTLSKTLFYSASSFIVSFLLFNSVISGFAAQVSK
ncbi:MAG: hypothetical protein QW797_00785 [Thermoproteota archaeon]